MPITLIFKDKPHKRYGKGADSVMVPPSKGKRGYYIPSEGALEQAEIDYIVEAQKEEKQERITQPRRVQIEGTKKDWEVEITEK